VGLDRERMRSSGSSFRPEAERTDIQQGQRVLIDILQLPARILSISALILRQACEVRKSATSAPDL